MVISSSAGDPFAHPEDPLAAVADGVTEAWRRGWEPADLDRFGERSLTRAQLGVLRAAITLELGSYPPSTLDPRWRGQLSEIAAAARRVERSTVGVPANGVRALLGALPRLERISPMPGTYRAPSGPDRPDAAAVDERILAKVRALLAKAESTTFEAEAETFTAGAQAMMARHSIDAALLAATHLDGVPDRAPGGRRVGIDNPYDTAKALLLDAVARANRCRCVWSRPLGFSTVVGYSGDLDAVETLFTSLLVQATQALNREGTRQGPGGRARSRGFRSSFLTAFALRIGERLSEATRAATEAAVAEAGESGRRRLLPVLASRERHVEQAFEELFPTVVSHSISPISDARGWYLGQSAADRACLAAGPALPP